METNQCLPQYLEVSTDDCPFEQGVLRWRSGLAAADLGHGAASFGKMDGAMFCCMVSGCITTIPSWHRMLIECPW
jgi:hypothetical protein